MSVASTTYQCVWIADLGASFTCSLLADGGDLFQTFRGDPTSPEKVSPDWTGATAKPAIRILLTESDPDMSQADLAGCVSDADTKWYIDGQLIRFNNTTGLSIPGTGSGELPGYVGCFRKLTAAAGANHSNLCPFGGLEICKDLVDQCSGQTINVRCVVGLTVGSKAVNLQASTFIRMVKVVGQSNFASIYCDAGQSFVLSASNKQVECKAKCWKGEKELSDTEFYCKWFLMEQGQWVQKSTAGSFTVSQDDIATFGDVKVVCYSDSARTNEIASDIQTVADTSDSLIVSPNPTPADGQFYQATQSPEKITFEPKVTDSDGNRRMVTGYWFSVYDSVGVPQPIGPGGATRVYVAEGGSFDLPYSVAEGINEGPVVNISAED